jgi:hypothetical protein
VIPEGGVSAPASPSAVPVDFGKVATDGSVRLVRQAPGVWTLTPFPRDHAFTVMLAPAAIDPALRAGVRIAALDANGHTAGKALTLAVDKWIGFTANLLPGAVSYRVTAK